jgi:broad specificity phosphatase PhoE
VIYLARHGQTEFNLARRYQGGLDSPLTPLGQAQAGRMGELLSRLIAAPADWRILASPLGRALATARIIRGKLGDIPDLATDTRLAEVSMGEWDGLAMAELEARRPSDQPYPERYFQAPGGETWEAFSGRVGAWVEDHRTANNLIVVCHGVTSRILRGLYARLPKEEMLDLDVPQDAIHRLSDGAIDRIACEGV